MPPSRRPTRLKHYFIAIAWFAGAMAIQASERAQQRRLEFGRREVMAEASAELSQSNSKEIERTRRRAMLAEENLTCCDWSPASYNKDLGVAIRAVSFTLLFVLADGLMFFGHVPRRFGVVIGVWTACLWACQYWPYLLPRSAWSEALGF